MLSFHAVYYILNLGIYINDFKNVQCFVVVFLDIKNEQQYRSTGFINRAGSLTSYNSSSQMSLTHGAYVLESDPVSWSQEFPMQRLLSL